MEVAQVLRAKKLVQNWFRMSQEPTDSESDDSKSRGDRKAPMEPPNPQTLRQESGSSASVVRVASTSTAFDEEEYDTAPGSPASGGMPASPTAEEILGYLYDKSRALHVDGKKLSPLFTEDYELRVFAGTWNLAGLGGPPENLSLDEWLNVNEPADIYVIGFQEIVPLNPLSVLGADQGIAVPGWESLIRRTLNEHTARVQLSRAASYGSNTRPSSPFAPEGFIPHPPAFSLPTSALPPIEPIPMPPPAQPLEQPAGPTGVEGMPDGALGKLHSEDVASPTYVPNVVDVSSPAHVPDLEKEVAVGGGSRATSPDSRRGGSPATPSRSKMGSPPKIPIASPSRSWGLLAREVQSGMMTGMASLWPGRTTSNSTETEERSTLLGQNEDDDDLGHGSSHLSSSPPHSVESGAHLEERYKRVVSRQMVGVHICIWVRVDLVKHVHSIKVTPVPTGVLSVFGNKGAVSVSMSLHETPMCFVCCHLSSGDARGDEGKRNQDVAKILQQTKFQREVDLGLPETILDHESCCIWLGDLNYRINKNDAEVRKLIAEDNLVDLWEGDQLRIQQEEGNVFVGWHEGPVNFMPTFKYVANTDVYVGDDPASKEKEKKTRTPAWCDRILWRGEKMRQESYGRSECQFSDHRPVRSTFCVTVSIFNPEKLEKALRDERSRLDALESESAPRCAFDKESLDLGKVGYGQHVSKTAKVRNTGTVPASWGATIAPVEERPCFWATCDPGQGELDVEEFADITVDAFVDTSTIEVEEVLERDGLLDGNLVVRLYTGKAMGEDSGRDIYLPCSARYLSSAWGIKLERLAALRQAVRETKFVRGGLDRSLSSSSVGVEALAEAGEASTSASLAIETQESESGEKAERVWPEIGEKAGEGSQSGETSEKGEAEKVERESRETAENGETEEGKQENGEKAEKGEAELGETAGKGVAESGAEAEAEGPESGKKAEEVVGVPSPSLVPKEIVRMVDFLLSDSIRGTPMLLEARCLGGETDKVPGKAPESHLGTESDEIFRADWATDVNTRTKVEERIGGVREAIDTGAAFPVDTTGPVVGAALLSLLKALPEPVMPARVSSLICGDASFGNEGAISALEKCGMPPVHMAVLKLLLDLLCGLLQHTDSNHITLSFATAALAFVLYPSVDSEDSSKRQRQFTRLLVEESLKK